MSNDAHVPDVVFLLHQLMYLFYWGPSTLWTLAAIGRIQTDGKVTVIGQAVSKLTTITRDAGTEVVHTPWLRIWRVRVTTMMQGLSQSAGLSKV